MLQIEDSAIVNQLFKYLAVHVVSIGLREVAIGLVTS